MAGEHRHRCLFSGDDGDDDCDDDVRDEKGMKKVGAAVSLVGRDGY